MRISDWSSDVCSSDVAALRAATQAQKRALIAAHPDLAGRLVRAGRLTTVSAKEQASAGLDLLTDAERARFTALNEAYEARSAARRVGNTVVSTSRSRGAQES